MTEGVAEITEISTSSFAKTIGSDPLQNLDPKHASTITQLNDLGVNVTSIPGERFYANAANVKSGKVAILCSNGMYRSNVTKGYLFDAGFPLALTDTERRFANNFPAHPNEIGMSPEKMGRLISEGEVVGNKLKPKTYSEPVTAIGVIVNDVNDLENFRILQRNILAIADNKLDLEIVLILANSGINTHLVKLARQKLTKV